MDAGQQIPARPCMSMGFLFASFPLVVVSVFLLSFTPVETSVCPEVPNLGLVQDNHDQNPAQIAIKGNDSLSNYRELMKIHYR